MIAILFINNGYFNCIRIPVQITRDLSESLMNNWVCTRTTSHRLCGIEHQRLFHKGTTRVGERFPLTVGNNYTLCNIGCMLPTAFHVYTVTVKSIFMTNVLCYQTLRIVI